MHFPLHVALVVLTTFLVVVPLDSTVQHLPLSQHMLHGKIFPDDDDFQEPVPNRERQYWIYTIDDLVETTETIVLNYYDLPNTLTDRIVGTDSVRTFPPSLFVTSYTEGMSIYDPKANPKLTTKTKEHELSEEDPLGPLGGEDVSDVIRTSKDIRLEMKLNMTYYRSDDFNKSRHNSEQYHVMWFLTVKYDFSARGGRVGISLWIDFFRQTDSFSLLSLNSLTITFYVSIILLLVSFCSFVLVLKDLIKSLFTKSKTKKNLKLINVSGVFDSVSDFDSSNSPNNWNFLFILTASFSIISSSFSLLQIAFSFSATSKSFLFVNGFACFLSWLCLLYYLKFIKDCGVLVLTLNRGMKIGISYVVGGMPIYFGYALFGTALFATVSEKFNTIGQSCVTLFALINGDEILEVFDDIYISAPVISRIYIYSYICFFIYCMLNIFIQIMEGAFIAAKRILLSKDDPNHPDYDSRAVGIKSCAGTNINAVDKETDVERMAMLAEVIATYEKHVKELTKNLEEVIDRS
ncbi:hypothetical protein P9112_000318 [Eukaryota sp. TZLM1-RC]